METVTPQQLDDLCDLFCEHMNIEKQTANAVLEFSLYTGFWIINVTKSEIRNGSLYINVPEGARSRMENLTSPHAATLLRAYQLRRLTVFGRVCKPMKKFCYALMFVAAATYAFLAETING